MIYKRGDSWHMDITVSGVRYRESLNTTDKRKQRTKRKIGSRPSRAAKALPGLAAIWRGSR